MDAKMNKNAMKMNEIMVNFLPFPGFATFFIMNKFDSGNEV